MKKKTLAMALPFFLWISLCSHAELGTAVHLPMLAANMNLSETVSWNNIKDSKDKNNDSIGTLFKKLKDTIRRLWSSPSKTFQKTAKT